MKKIFILIAVFLISFSSFAQKKKATQAQAINSEGGIIHTSAARTATIGDTTTLANINPTDTLTIYRAGAGDTGGYATGTNLWNDLAFAERYNINGNDSAVRIIGIFAEFSGKVNPASAKRVVFTIWSNGGPQQISATASYNGFPGYAMDTVSVPVTQLGIGPVKDTFKRFMFATPAYSGGSFFAGYSINYNASALNGDTLGLVCTRNGIRQGGAFSIDTVISDIDTTVDTVINVQNATLSSDNNWYDNYTQNDSLYNNLAVFPVVAIVTPSAVKGITRNDLTFFGNYPNPADGNTNIKFSLASIGDITIQVMDMKGQLLSTLTQSNMASGAHSIPVNTNGMPSGDYICLLRTSHGDGIACKISVIH